MYYKNWVEIRETRRIVKGPPTRTSSKSLEHVPERVGKKLTGTEQSELEQLGMAITSEVHFYLVASQKAIREALNPNFILHFPSNSLLVTSVVKRIEKQKGKGTVGAVHEGASEAQNSIGEKNWQGNTEPQSQLNLEPCKVTGHCVWCIKD